MYRGSIMEQRFLPSSKSWKHIFVYESNAIDPQPGHPGYKPGQLMFDNHLSALDFAVSDGWELTVSTPLDLHRILTKHLPFFEDSGNSGLYRKCDVWIGHELCPSALLIPNLMDQWFNHTRNMIDKFDGKYEEARNIAWMSHHMFQVIHPFIDGNGRTGRLLQAKVMHDLGFDPEIVFFDDREFYYNSIQFFRNEFWSGKQFHLNDII